MRVELPLHRIVTRVDPVRLLGFGRSTATKARQGYATVKAKDPHDGREWDVLLPDKRLEWAKRNGVGAVRELAYTVPWALQNIRHMFRGVRDDDCEIDDEDDKWLCYVSTPPRAYDWRTGNQVDAWRDEVFLVYVTDERVVYQWSWVKADPNDPCLPIGYLERFKTQVF